MWSKALAGRLLVDGGLSFQLHNDGSSSPNGRRSAWRCYLPATRSPLGGAAASRPKLTDTDYASRLTPLTIPPEMGAEPLVGVRTMARAMPGARLFRVLWERVAMRATPSTDAKILGVRSRGDEARST